GARACGLADAYATEYDDVSGMYWNPATLAFLQNSSLMTDFFHESNGQVSHEAIAYPLTLGQNNNVGVGLSSDQFSLTDSVGNNVNGREYGMDLGSAVALTSTLSIGTQIHVIYGQVSSSTIWVTSAAFGLLYAPSTDIGYALVYNGVGAGILYGQNSQGSPIPSVGKVPVPSTLHLGVTMRFPSASVDRILMISLANEKVFNQRGINYKGAVEVEATSFLELRAGCIITPLRSGLRYGLGLHVGPVQLDYAYSPPAIAPEFHELTLSLGFDTATENGPE
ncbi:MAG TPA: hypothetical protein VI758_12680, partial [Bacteroidota bacterium]